MSRSNLKYITLNVLVTALLVIFVLTVGMAGSATAQTGATVEESVVDQDGSQVTIRTGGAVTVAVSNLPTDSRLTDISENGVKNDNEIRYANLRGLPETVSFTLTPPPGAETVEFDIGEKSVTLEVTGNNNGGVAPTPSQIWIQNLAFTPTTVAAGTSSTHTLTFDAVDVSADGQTDTFTISLPDSVTLDNVGDISTDQYSVANIETDGNSIEFAVNPDGDSQVRDLSISTAFKLTTAGNGGSAGSITVEATDSANGADTATTTLSVVSDSQPNIPSDIPISERKFNAIDQDNNGEISRLEFTRAKTLYQSGREISGVQLTQFDILSLEQYLENDTGGDGPTAGQIKIQNLALSPATVTAGTSSTHTLTFDAVDVSADGQTDTFTISLPNTVALDNIGEVSTDRGSVANIRTDTNSIEFTVNPDGDPQERDLSITTDFTLTTAGNGGSAGSITVEATDSASGADTATTTLSVVSDSQPNVPSDIPSQITKTQYSAIDRNGDGIISQSEFTRAENEWRNNNGRISGVSFTRLELVILEDYINQRSDNFSPTASFTYSPATPLKNDSITFDASSSSAQNGTITDYEWDFNNDGTVDASGEVVTYAYPTPGMYQASLTVTDNNGFTNITSKTINIESEGDDGYVDVDLGNLNGSGTSLDPYIITNVSELQAMKQDLDAHYTLGEDVNASATARWNEARGFDPIGGGDSAFSDEVFNGTFDGNGYNITGLVIDRPSEQRVGLFGETGDGAKISNVSLFDISVVGDRTVGGLVGLSGSGSISKTSVTGNITAAGRVGGLIGSNNAAVQQSVANTEINTTGFNAGGLIGFNNGPVSESYAIGSVTGQTNVGGLIGSNSADQIIESYAAIEVSGNENVGGIVGRNDGTISTSYFNSDETEQNEGVGKGDTGGVESLSADEMTGSVAETNMAGFEFGSIWETQPDDYPTLIAVPLETDNNDNSSEQGNTTGFVDVDVTNLAGTGTDSDPYLITNASELQAMEDDLDAHYELINDIDASNTARWNNGNGFDPVGGSTFTFTGSLDGNKNTINDLIINRSDENNVGIIGYNGAFGNGSYTIVKNISLSNITVTGSNNVGGIVGTNDRGLVENVTVEGSVSGEIGVGGLIGSNDVFGGGNIGTIRNVTATVNVNGSNSVGGLVGSSNGIIRNATATGSINGSNNVGGLVGWNDNSGLIENTTATGKINGQADVGGLVGSSNGIVRNTIATGSVNGSNRVGGVVGGNDNNGDVRNATATGSVNGSNNVGGLVGGNYDNATIRNATAKGSVEGWFKVGGLVGTSDNSLIRNAMAEGSVNGSYSVGGLIGENRGSVEDTFAVGPVTGSTDVGGLVGAQDPSGSIQDSYWDKLTTGQTSSAGANASGLTTGQMTGEAAKMNMTGLEFGYVWQAVSDNYPTLVQQANITSDQSGSNQVELYNITLSPQSVDSGLNSTHRLTFEAHNVSADGRKDEFDITFPDKVELVNYSHVEIDEKSSDVNKVDNTLEFSVDPTGGGSTQISGELNVTVSATN